jgi:SAM-dependent methyltransferase
VTEADLAENWTQSTIAKEWDSVALARDAQIRSGEDISYSRVLLPTLWTLSRGCRWDSVLDVGCGSGFLTEKLATRARLVTGVDISPISIQLAKRSPRRPSNVMYHRSSVEHFARRSRGNAYSLVVANMVLQDVPRLRRFLTAVARLVKPGGCLVATLTHPLFWPSYWKYADSSWFTYRTEVAIRAPFRISLSKKPVGWTTHFHRPLSAYVNSLLESGFAIDRMMEPMPNESLAARYPVAWKFPRFLAVRCTREAPHAG